MVESEFQGIQREICLVYNEKFSEYGSGYSLFLGLKKALELCADEVVFAEGDLYVDRQSYMSVYRATGGVVTCNNEPISADRSVAFTLIAATKSITFMIQGIMPWRLKNRFCQSIIQARFGNLAIWVCGRKSSGCSGKSSGKGRTSFL